MQTYFIEEKSPQGIRGIIHRQRISQEEVRDYLHGYRNKLTSKNCIGQLSNDHTVLHVFSNGQRIKTLIAYPED